MDAAFFDAAFGLALKISIMMLHPHFGQIKARRNFFCASVINHPFPNSLNCAADATTTREEINQVVTRQQAEKIEHPITKRGRLSTENTLRIR